MDRVWKNSLSPAVLWSLWVLVFALASAMFPRDASYDVVHYHIHNGWSALEGRLDKDLAPAEIHSFLNPAYNLWVYWLMVHLPGRVVAMILSVPQALILPALYYLTRNILSRSGAKASAGILLLISLTGFLAEPQMTLFASVRNDTWGTLGFITALLLIVPKDNRYPTQNACALASLILGFLMGLKPTNAIYVAGFALAILTVLPDMSQRLRAGLVCAVSGLIGIFAGGGAWAMALWTRFENPLFPLANGVFNAPLGPHGSLRDTRYLPDGFLEGLVRPFHFFLDGSLINEHDFFDARFLLGYLAAIGILLVGVFARGAKIRTDLRPAIALALALLTAVITWTYMFSIERYISAAWVLGPTLAATFLSLLAPSVFTTKTGLYATLFSTLGLMMSTQSVTVRRAPWQSWSEPYVWAHLPDGADTENAIIMFAGGYPSAFAAIAFPKSATLTHAAAPGWSAPMLDNYRLLIDAEISNTRRNLFAVIYNAEDHYDETLAKLRQDHNLKLETEACAYLDTAFDTGPLGWVLCPLTRIARPAEL